MKIKTVKRYYCDYCKISKGTKSSMVKHERGCTMNPNRVCGMCADAEPLDGDECLDRAEIIKRLQIKKNSYIDIYGKEVDGGVWDITDEQMKWLRIQCANCPACILAVIRQGRLNLPEYFDYKKESVIFWRDKPAEWPQ